MDMKTSPLALLNDPTLLKTDALINGEWVAGSNRFEVTDPATGLKLVDVANLGVAETAAALDAANRAWPAWRNKSAKGRGESLLKWYQLLHLHADVSAVSSGLGRWHWDRLRADQIDGQIVTLA